MRRQMENWNREGVEENQRVIEVGKGSLNEMVSWAAGSESVELHKKSAHRWASDRLSIEDCRVVWLLEEGLLIIIKF